MKIGDKFSKAFSVDLNKYNNFIKLSKDENPMHTDKKFSKKYGFKSLIVHGNLLNVFISYSVGQLLPIKNVIILDQTIKYINPIYLNSIVSIEMNITNIIESVNVFKFKYFFIDDSNKTKVASGTITIKELR